MKKNLRNKLTVDNRQVTKVFPSIITIVSTLALLVVFLVSCNKDTADQHDTYTCPMHPTVISDRPGSCPVCGMDLVRKARPGEEVEITEDLARLLKSPNEIVVASVKTIKGEYKSMAGVVEAQGVVTYDTRNLYTISSRIGGRLEKVLLKYEFEPVTKGQKVAEIYSPELITAQRELLFLYANDAGNQLLIDAANNRLRLLGMTDTQIKSLVERKEASNTFSVFSPYSGYLITSQQAPTTPAVSNAASPQAGGGMDDGMGSTTPQPVQQATGNPGAIIREGMYVSAGQTLFNVANTDALRVELDLPAKQAASIAEGTKLEIDFGNGRTQDTQVDFVQPFFTQDQDLVKLRVVVRNSTDLHIGHLVHAKINLPPTESLWVPTEAVLDLGTDKVLFIKERTVLKPRKVTTGVIADGMIEIKSGLASSEEIAANAQYLVDSESFIKSKN